MAMHMPTRCFSAELKNLAEIRSFVAEASASLGADAEATYDLVQAVDEAATNIIIHGYREGPGAIEVDVVRCGDFVAVTLRDQAPVFDPTRVPAPNLMLPLEKRKIGGLGTYLIRQSVDEVRHRALPAGGNELALIKRAALPGP
jgi:anti-sigma regulatory factor (Ser/Thr protein kinase)